MAKPVRDPHRHDVLSGRGNFVNYHEGNEYFRRLVREHKLDYVACPKQTKGKFSKLIVEAIRARDPPGRFLKQEKDTKLWYDIGEKKALDKTRQALREGAPEIVSNGSTQDDGDTALKQPPIEQQPTIEQRPAIEQHPTIEQQQQQQQIQQLSNSEHNMLQQSIISIGNDSFSPGSGMMSQHTFASSSSSSSNNRLSGTNNHMSGISMLTASLYDSLGVNDALSSSNNDGLGNRSGLMNLSEIITSPPVHDPNPNMEQHLLQQQQQSLQEEQWQRLRLLQHHQQRQRQSQQQQFTSQQQQEIIRNATAVIGADFRSNHHHHQQQNNHMHMQHQPTQIHMDQLKINRQNDKRKLQEQFEMLQNQQRMNEYNHNQHQQMQQQQQQYQSRSGMRESLTNKLKDIYAGTDANLEPLPMVALTPNNITSEAAAYVPDSSSSGGNIGEYLSSKRRESRGPGIVRENSLKMEAIFENGCDNHDSGGISGGTNSHRKKIQH
mmetsp:Transcript_11341/g.24077  ORF Transcript_11341/g.24077 Transcript_11341/m.24077 type:complete len:493 (+) Transcript_11341:104-1582(+)